LPSGIYGSSPMKASFETDSDLAAATTVKARTQPDQTALFQQQVCATSFLIKVDYSNNYNIEIYK